MNTHVYFALTGENLDPQIITDSLGINPTELFQKGDKGTYNSTLEYGCWKLSSDKGIEYLNVEYLIESVINKLFDKIEQINKLKVFYHLNSILEIVLFVDTNEENPAPIVGYDLENN